eukprot:4217747-Pleurochrysis_carterae.AAC.1
MSDPVCSSDPSAYDAQCAGYSDGAAAPTPPPQEQPPPHNTISEDVSMTPSRRNVGSIYPNNPRGQNRMPSQSTADIDEALLCNSHFPADVSELLQPSRFMRLGEE